MTTSQSLCTAYGYSIMDLLRDTASADTGLVNHDGLALLYRSNYIARRIQLPEVLVCSLRLAAISQVSVTINRPGSRAPCNEFFLKFTSLFAIITIDRCSLLISGDFSVFVGDINDNNGMRFAAIFDSFDLIQHICQPTHSCGHTLDLVITRSEEQPSSVNIEPPVYSDHGLVQCCLPLNIAINNSCNQYRTKLTRNWKQLDITSFICVIRRSAICNYTLHLTMSATGHFNTYQHTLAESLNGLVLAVNRTFKDRPLFPWFDNNCRNSCRFIRSLKRRYRVTNHAADREAWRHQIERKRLLFQLKESSYWTNKISTNKNNPKHLWQCFNSILMRDDFLRTQPTNLTASDLSFFFTSKLEVVSSSTARNDTPTFRKRT